MLQVTLHLGEQPVEVQDGERVVTVHPGQRVRLAGGEVPVELLPLLAARPARCTVSVYEPLTREPQPAAVEPAAPPRGRRRAQGGA